MATVYRDVVYGSHPNQRVNLYQPDNYDIVTEYGITIRGVILWIHGGGWISGSKDISINNYTSYFTSDAWAYLQAHPNFNNNFFDDDFCKVMADAGYFVISANYRLASFPNTLSIYNGGGGEYPNNVNDIEELYKYMVFPGYAPSSNVNKASWDLIVRYVGTYGLLVIGGSAGGHLAVIGAFEGAGKTGRWPKGIGSVVGPLNINYNSTDNQLGEFGRILIDTYATTDANTQRLASPWWRTNPVYNPNGISYENYAGFNDLTQQNQVQNKMRMFFFYNQNDNLVPLTTVEPFKDWVTARLGSGYVKYNKVNEVDPRDNFYYKGVYNSSTTYTSFDVVLFNGTMYKAQRTVQGIAPSNPPNTTYWNFAGESHNLLSQGVTFITEGATFTFKQGMSFPRNNNKVRPTEQGWNFNNGYGNVRGMVYPRQRSYRYKQINTTPSYTV